MRSSFYTFLICLSLILAQPALSEEPLKVAVAANFSAPMKQLAKHYESSHQQVVKLSFGSSGKLYSQISHGAPFHIFLSADQSKPEALIKHGFAVAGSQFTYAEGALALWTAQQTPVKELRTRLISGQFNKLALANPKLAPYGQAAFETLRKLNLVSATKAKWVQGESITQTYQFVATGNAEIGFIALSQIYTQPNLNQNTFWQVPEDFYHPIKQDAVLLNKGAKLITVQDFIQFLKSEQARQIMRAYGYQTGRASNSP